MTAYPLEAPLASLSPTRRVYIARRGLVFLYPASIVADIANDRYTMDDDRPWSPTPAEWHVGDRLHARVAGDLVDHTELRALARTAWKAARDDVMGDDRGFDLWWESVNPDAHPEWIGAAAMVASREVMTWPLFQHRHMVDDVHTFP